MNAVNCRKAVATWLAVALLSSTLMACGTLEVGIERTPTPDHAVETRVTTPTPLTILPGTVFEFVSYIHPHWGYQLSIPNGAKITHSQEGRLTTFAYEDTDLIGGSYVLEVEIIPDPIMDSPDELLKWLTGGVDDPSPIRTVAANGGLISGAAISYAAGAGEWCPQMRALTAVFIAEGRGYVLRIKSDAPVRCNAETVPQTAPVVDSFRLLPADAYETSASALGKLAYVQGGDIWAKALPDGEPQRLTTDGRNSEPRWSPSGEWLAFRKGEFKQVWVMRADGSDARSLMAVPDGAFAWSPVADRLAYADGDRLKVVSANGTDPATLVAGLSVTPPTPPPRKENTVFHIAWNPDGTWIAYEWMERHIDQGLVYQGLWKVLAEDGKPVELYASGVPEKGDAILAGWSLDNQHILFWQGYMLSASMLADGVALYSLPANGGEPTKLVDAVLVHDDFLAPAPRGDRLAVTAGGSRATWTNKRVAVIEARGGELTGLTDESVAAFSPAWSPDGVHLAYVAMPDRGDLGGGENARLGMMERRIWVINAQGKPQLQQLTDDPAYRDERPLWSADGSRLLFARMDAEGRASLWLIPAGGGDPRRVVDELTPLPGPALGWFGYYGHVDWDQLFDWWRGLAAQEVSLSHRDQLSAEILDALVAYQPVTDARPTVTTLLSDIVRWLDTGGDPSDLAAVLNKASDRTEGTITVTELDLTGDGRDDVVVRIPIMGLPLLVFLNTGGSPAHFGGYALPADFETIQHGWPVELTAYEIEQPALQLTDLTGDGIPEVLLSYMFAGGSNFQLRPQVFQWHEGDFRMIFAAELVSWVGYSTLALEPNPVGGQDIVLHYPHLYATGFEAKMIAHPWATQRWRWEPSLERYMLRETSCDLESVLADGGDVSEWELLRVLVNEAELLYQASDLEEALAGYQDVITRAADMKRPKERAPHWPAYARFRIAQVQALLGQARAAQAELSSCTKITPHL